MSQAEIAFWIFGIVIFCLAIVYPVILYIKDEFSDKNIFIKILIFILIILGFIIGGLIYNSSDLFVQ